MNSIKLKTAAKVNLSLDILGRFPNGYHELDMIVSPISLFDAITITRSHGGIVLHCDQGIPTDERNIAYRAAQLLMVGRDIPGVTITISKRIPSQAGLGGGSSDGAAVLYGMNELFDLKLTEQELMDIGVKLGADVPLFLAESAVRAKGIGEIIEPVTISRPLHMVILKPEAGLSTVEVYGLCDTNPKPFTVPTDQLVKGLDKGDLSMIIHAMGNVMEPIAKSLCPDVQVAIDALLTSGAMYAQMSGSGSAVFGIFRSASLADQAHQELINQWSICERVESLDQAIFVEQII